MPRPQSVTLTPAELRLMDILWERGASTVQALVEALPKSSPLAYNSVLTTIRILEKKGYVRHQKSGRAHVYAPQVDRRDATRFEVGNLVSRFFKNSHELLVLNLLEERIDAPELNRLRRLLREHSAPPAGNRPKEERA